MSSSCLLDLLYGVATARLAPSLVYLLQHGYLLLVLKLLDAHRCLRCQLHDLVQCAIGFAFTELLEVDLALLHVLGCTPAWWDVSSSHSLGLAVCLERLIKLHRIYPHVFKLIAHDL